MQGVGAFATVWRGYDEELDIPVAVKVLADNWAHHADVRERFLEEARLLRRIDDPRVVKVHDVGVADDRPYFVMDFLTGGTVADRARDGLELEKALRFAAEASRGVQALHEPACCTGTSSRPTCCWTPRVASWSPTSAAPSASPRPAASP